MSGRAAKLASLLLPLLACACVSSARYDAAIKGGDELRVAAAKDAKKQRSLQGQLDDATVENASLRQELDQLGTDADKLLAQRGTLASALAESRQRLDELRRAQAAADLRAKQYRDLAARMQKMVDAGDLRVVLRDGRMVLQLPNDVLFQSGRVDIKPKGREALSRIAAVLATIPNRNFQVAGHTDDVPTAMSGYPSNWELSTARGVEVVRFLVAGGVAPSVLAAAGYGEFDPIAPNTDDKGRMQNRRIEITLQPNVDELVRVRDLP